MRLLRIGLIGVAVSTGCSRPWGTLEAALDDAQGSDASAFETSVDVPEPADQGSPVDVPLGFDAQDARDVQNPADVADIIVPPEAASDGCVDACEPACPTGSDRSAPGQPCLPVVAPRQMAPMSNSVLGRAGGTMRAIVPLAAPGEVRPRQVRFEICDTPSCAAPAGLLVDVPTGSTDVTVSSSSLSPGWHSWRVSALDSAGGVAVSTPWWVMWSRASGTATDKVTGFSPRDVTGPAGDGFDDALAAANAAGNIALALPGIASGLGNNAISLVSLSSSGTGAFGDTLAVVGPVASTGGTQQLVAVGDSMAESVALYTVGTSAPGASVSVTATLQNTTGSQFGTSLVALGDADGGGRADFAVGAPSSDTVFVYGGEDVLMSELPMTTGRCRAPCAHPGFGTTVANAGDVDGDGRTDMLVGTLSGTHVEVLTRNAPGGAYVVSSTLDLPGAALTGMAGVGDLNRDGYGDVVITTDMGVSVFLSQAGTFPTSVPDYSFPLGGITGVAATGDMDGDTWPDFAVANHGSGDHSIKLFFGLYSPWAMGPSVTWPTFSLDQNDANGAMGEHIAAAGDVNGDDLADLIASDEPSNRIVLWAGVSLNHPGRIDVPSPSGLTNFSRQLALRPPLTPRGSRHRRAHPLRVQRDVAARRSG